ncbi:hypothetical protein [Alicyclobacillus sp. ALC3]|uniref:hypothetical protein n=1 Tax=Alicyclobacillus sp. ALC3 TaxID=2796143 RepID=UPI002379BEAF|nr:hypothetical protein [Alicyclobacillus sp. ALC3]WDL98781.1 hypothetical protein JC200_09060 [Alicyclobacillus sp. ALC3]
MREVDKLRLKYDKLTERKMPRELRNKIYSIIEEHRNTDHEGTLRSRRKHFDRLTTSVAVVAAACVTALIIVGVMIHVAQQYTSASSIENTPRQNTIKVDQPFLRIQHKVKFTVLKPRISGTNWNISGLTVSTTPPMIHNKIDQVMFFLYDSTNKLSFSVTEMAGAQVAQGRSQVIKIGNINAVEYFNSHGAVDGIILESNGTSCSIIYMQPIEKAPKNSQPILSAAKLFVSGR